MTRPVLSAVVCTHNPREAFLSETLAALRRQTGLAGIAWELLVIDNASDAPLAGRVDLSWHASARVVREDRLGLTYARFRSFHEAQGEVLVYIDDDNVLATDYLAESWKAFAEDASLGAIGGRVAPRYESQPPQWFDETGVSLACRDLGDKPIHAAWSGAANSQHDYPPCAPLGAGIGVRRSAYAAYISGAQDDPVRASLGRRGASLASGEDNDMILSILEAGWRIAYLPQLELEHIIPASRLTTDYLARHAYSSTLTWVTVLDVHGIRPWPPIPRWTTKLRQARAYLRMKAWRSPANLIRWRGACGQFAGQALLGVKR